MPNSPQRDLPESGPLPQEPMPGDTPPDAERKIARTASVTVVVDDVKQATQGLHDLADKSGGWIVTESVSLPDDADPRLGSATIQISVPATLLDNSLSQIETMGKVTNRRIEAEDVTEQVVDVESRIITMRQSIARLQELLTQSGSVSDIAAVEAELTRRQADLEALLAVQKSLEQRVATSTISVSLRTPSVAQDFGFLSAILAGWEAMLTAGRYLIIVIGALLPWLALAAVIVVPIVVVRRRRRAARVAAGEPPKRSKWAAQPGPVPPNMVPQPMMPWGAQPVPPAHPVPATATAVPADPRPGDAAKPAETDTLADTAKPTDTSEPGDARPDEDEAPTTK